MSKTANKFECTNGTLSKDSSQSCLKTASQWRKECAGARNSAQSRSWQLKVLPADTATFWSRKAAMEFFSEGHVLVACNAPFDPEGEPDYIRDTSKPVDRIDITDEQRRKIYDDNAVKLLGLTL